ncbi:hypothetical protein A33Q_1670 [Indibacter alkaliphilus LW1]|uniref:Uncharacterized protein n=1 Tax=Indibacter alkaliphilus (strain CCUG 57479 / KCTC 22604 / LW1) TaxID=1189612 RepID=S2E0A5_INDAL|nr:hypothetical protein A33Q_1670 [Indibacter alkaliphilus LW1]
MKYNDCTGDFVRNLPFNRTIQELKSTPVADGTKTEAGLQSHHTGIEII